MKHRQFNLSFLRSRYGSLAMMFLFVVLATSMVAGGALAQWNLDTIDNSGDVGKYADIAYDSNGYPHVAYFFILL